MLKTNLDYMRWFRNIAPYVNAHRGNTFVIALPGEALEDANFSNLLHDIALLHSLGVKLLIVHGCRPQVESRLAARGIESEYHENLRITNKNVMTHVVDASSSIKNLIEAQLSMGLPNSPLSGAKLKISSGNFITTQPLGVVDGVDLEFTGKVRRVDGISIAQQLDLGAIVLQSPLGHSSTGETFNIALHDAAVSISSAINADKLILCDAKQGLMIRDELVRQCRTGDLPDSTEIEESQVWLLSAVQRACKEGIPRCHIISFAKEGALLEELFTHDGVGTLVTKDEYEQLRAAALKDIGGILELIRPLEEKGILAKRSRKLLEEEIGQFRLLERDGRIIACAALYPFREEKTAELACIVTDPNYRGKARGRRLLKMLEQEAKDLGLETFFVLTTQTDHWFLENEFIKASPKQLPKSRQSIYNLQRNSKVLVKVLT